MRALLLLALIAMLVPFANAQVNYSQNFNVNNGSWTGFTRFTGATACGGSGGAMRFNLYSGSTTANMVSPSTGTAVGGLCTIGYTYKANIWSANTAAAPVPWGTFTVQHGTSAAGPWTNIATVTNEVQSGACITKSHTFTPPSGALFIRFTCAWQGGDYYLNFDNITITEATGPCTNPPTVGAIQSSSASPCGNFTLSMIAPPTGTGLTYQWQRADDAAYSVNLTNLGTTATQVTQLPPGTTGYYRIGVQCSGGTVVYSTQPFSVTSSATPVAICGSYCIPTTTVGCTDNDVIGRVTLNTLDNNPGPGGYCESGILGYSNFTTSPNPLHTTTLQAGSSYSCTVYPSQYSEGYAAWIDYNDDGIFNEVTERIGDTGLGQAIGSGIAGVLGTPATFPVALACNPPLGPHRLRVRCMYATIGDNVTACAANTYGETEDYLITMSAAVPCPAPANLAATVTSNSATLSWTTGCAETLWDVHFQAFGGGAPGTPSNPGLTSTSLLVPGLSPGNYEFYVRAVCGGLAGTSTWAGPFAVTLIANDECSGAIPLTIGANGSCPGANTPGTTVGATVSSNLAPSCLITGLPDVFYSFNSGSNTSVLWNVTLGTMGAIGVQVLNGCNGAEVYCLGDQTSGVITVTTNTDYIFRVLTVSGFQGTFGICLQSPPAPSCVVAPTSPANGGSACSTAAVTLSWPATLYASSYEVILDGLTVSPAQAGTTFAAGILSAGPHTWSVIPSGSGGTASGCATWSFTTSLFGCYCASAATTTADEEIYSVTVNGVNNALACGVAAPGSGSLAYQYSNFFPLGNVFSVQKGVPSTFDVEENECDGATFFSFGTAIWIDYDQNGTFNETTERVFIENVTNAGPRNVVGGFTPPIDALEGTTVMRVTVAEGFSETSFTPLTACLSYGFGETEDYLITVLPPPTSADATPEILDDCLSAEFSIDVFINTFGNGTPGNIIYTVNGGPDNTVAAAIGSNVIGSFSVTDIVNVTVTNNTISDLELGDFFSGCPIIIDCGTTTTLSHCYSNVDTRTFTFEPSDAGETLTLTFVSGTMATGDVIRVYDGPDNSFPSIATLTGSFANLAGAVGSTTVPGQQMYMEIDSDESNSCFTGEQTTWVFEVECTAGCVDPTGSAVLNQCNSTIDVTIDFTGDAVGGTAGVRYIVNGGTPVDAFGYVEFDVVTIGPFTPGQQVQVVLLHEDQINSAACNHNLGTYNIPAVPTPPTLIMSATPSTICTGGSSQLSAQAVTTSAIPNYEFSTTTGGTLASMTGSTSLVASQVDDFPASAVTGIGFPFFYGGTTYTDFSANTNGLMRLGTSQVSTTYINDLDGPGDTPKIMPWWDDQYSAQDGGVTTVLLGSPGSYIRVIDWKVVNCCGFIPWSRQYQVWLFENGAIEFHYGVNAEANFGSSIGITGFAPTSFQSVNSASHVASNAVAEDGNITWPGNGRIYRFQQPGVAGTTYLWSPSADLDDATIATPLASNLADDTEFTVTATVPGGCAVSASVTVTVNPSITSASITPDPASFCAGGAVTLTATPDDGVPPFTYAWTDPNNAPAGTASQVNATIAGDWTCTVTDACGEDAVVTRSVTENPVPTASISSTTPICGGGDVTLTLNTDIGTEYSWSGASPVGGSTTQDVTITGVTGANAGTYTATATLNGCTSTPASFLLTVNPTPNIGGTSATPSTVCSGGSSVLDVTVLPPGLNVTIDGTGFWNDEVSWTMTNALNQVIGSGGPYGFSQVNSQGLGVQLNGPFTFDIEAQGNFNDNSAIYTILCGGAVIATGTVLQGGTAQASGLACSLSVTYVWAGGPFLGGIDNTQSVTGTNITGTTLYGVTVTSAAGCASVATQLVDIFPVPTVSCGGPYGPYCVNDADVTLVGSPVGGTWSGTGVTGSSFDPSAGSQILTYSYSEGGCDYTCQVSITVSTADTDGDGLPDCADSCPSVTGQVGSPCEVSGFAIGALDANCECIGAACTTNLAIEFQLDGSSTVNWEIRTQGSGLLVQNGTANIPLPGSLTQNTCVPDGCYYLVVTDDVGDGITSNGVQGGYVLRTTGTVKRLIDNRNNFLSGYTSQIVNNGGFCVPMGNDRLITAHCDRMDLQRGANAQCSERLTADNTPNNTSGNVYQFWVYNPNGLESQLIPATGAGSSVLSMNQVTLPAGKMYNVKVRTRISPGVWRPWGPACRMSISATPTPCRLTMLVDDLTSPNWSCGKTVTLPVVGGGNGALNLLVAKPATRLNTGCVEVGANKYQFRFTNVDNNVVTEIYGQGSNYFCYMTQPTFAPCSEYLVEVRASFNGIGGPWCAYSTSCTVFTGGCIGGGGQNSGAEGSNLSMYPNPNRGDQLFLNLNEVADGVESVSVDIYDAFGRRVSARTIAVQDGFINTVLELNGELAAGVYMVNITAGDATYIERLAIQP